MLPREYARRALEKFAAVHPGAFYGSANGVSLGAGLFVDSVHFPLFDPNNRAFDTVAGPVFVLTHECDIDQANERHFNTAVSICPVLPMEDLVAEYEPQIGEARLLDLVIQIARDKVYRMTFLPPVPELLGVPKLADGGFLYFNEMCSTHVTSFAPEVGARPLFALSTLGLDRIDLALKQHLFRPKAEGLAALK